MSDQAWPTELRLREQGTVFQVTFEGSQQFDIAAELLRVESPSAEVKGHGPGQEQLVWGKRNVKITRVEPVGNYAVRLVFNDGHSTGIFTWPYLQRLGRDGTAMMQAYEDKLAAARLTRG